MFRIFGSKTKYEVMTAGMQAVIVSCRFASGTELGTPHEQLQVGNIEKKLATVLIENEELDGHNIGDGEVTFYLYSKDADSLWGRVSTIFSDIKFGVTKVTLRYGAADTVNVVEKVITL